MEALLKQDFTTHYGLPEATIEHIAASTSAPYFELKDDQTLVYTTIGQGVAKYSNENTLTLTVINFESFFNSLSPSFIHRKEKCDLIVHDNNSKYILLNELTDTLPHYVTPYINTRGSQPGKRQKARAQLLSTLTLLMNVPIIATFVSKHTFRHCCFFNKQAMSPPILTATTAFNRLGSIRKGGLKMSNPSIEAFDFEFWEYSGNQVYQL